MTTAGEHTFTLDYIEDTAASEGEQSHFRPVEELIEFDGKKRYQEDISTKAAVSPQHCRIGITARR